MAKLGPNGGAALWRKAREDVVHSVWAFWALLSALFPTRADRGPLADQTQAGQLDFATLMLVTGL